jgi:hydroxymethylglutaryl-CoA lyase
VPEPGHAHVVPWTLPRTVVLRDVGPRDGLQVERPLTVSQRQALVRAIAAAGLTHIEVGAFVSPRAVPAMADSAAVLRGLADLEGVTRTALVPNSRGARDALEAGADELTVTLSASEAYNQRNVRMSLTESIEEVGRICALATAADVPVDAVISCAFGSPYEGEIAPEAVAVLAEELTACGAARLTYADTTGMATPRGVRALLEWVAPDGAHFHESRGTGLVNVFAALACGMRRFDTSLGGLGGSPFADGAAGNVSTEDVVSMLDDLGVETGVDLPALLVAGRRLRDLVGHDLPSAVAKAGSRLPR